MLGCCMLQLCPRGSRWLWLAQHPGEVRCLVGTAVRQWVPVCFSREFALGLAEIRGFWRGHPGAGEGTSHYQLGLWFWAWVLCQEGFMVTPNCILGS